MWDRNKRRLELGLDMMMVLSELCGIETTMWKMLKVLFMSVLSELCGIESKYLQDV